MKAKSVFFLFLFFALLSFARAQTQIPDCLLSYRFGPEQHVLVVEKSTQTLLVYNNYKPEPVDRFTITSGKATGPKLEEGDLRTPEGLYFARRILTGDELPKVEDYGDKAFTLNYPNPVDHLENRGGSGIWLHGAFAEDKTHSPNNSRGCVVMQNGDLVKVSRYIYLNKTPVCIYDKIRYDTVENIAKKRDRFIEGMKQWKSNWETKDIDNYITYYHPRYRSGKMNRDQFKNYKNNLNKTYKFIKVTLSEINLYRYKNYYVVTFNQLYISDRNHFYNKKIQYWVDSPRTAQIVDEYTFPLPAIQRFELNRGNFVSIDKFRRDYLRQLEASTMRIQPASVQLTGLSVEGRTVTLKLNLTSGRNLKVVPVLRMEEGGTSQYTTLEGIKLQGGIPQDYDRAVSLDRGTANVVFKKNKDSKLQSLTLFLVNRDNKPEQIVTYFINR